METRAPDSSAMASLPATPEPDKDTIAQDYPPFPVDSTLSTKILPVGTFHHDEVWDNAAQLKWFGLFKRGERYYLEKTKIRTKRVHDMIVDEDEDEKTGWEVTSNNKDSCIMLVEALPYLKNRKVQAVKLDTTSIYPGDTLSFRYLDVDYTLFATGNKKKEREDQEGFEIWNYNLYLTATIDGRFRQSLLAANPGYNSYPVQLIFAGDIDGDNVLDLIIDTYTKENADTPTLYLSKPADEGEIVKPVGVHSRVGC